MIPFKTDVVLVRFSSEPTYVWMTTEEAAGSDLVEVGHRWPLTDDGTGDRCDFCRLGHWHSRAAHDVRRRELREQGGPSNAGRENFC